MFIAAQLDRVKGCVPKRETLAVNADEASPGRKNMKIEKRIRALEARMSSDPVVLHFADGSTRELRGQRYFLLDLIGVACRGADISASQAAQLEAVRQSLWAEEPDGGRLTEVIRILPGPTEERGNP
jgi:phosphosulfolactate synthase (CoM biosynthesis protein A)